jgi:hypothetical protein
MRQRDILLALALRSRPHGSIPGRYIRAPDFTYIQECSSLRVSGMKIDSTEFGSITINGTTYTHDILIQLSGEVVKRKKKLSKKHYGTSHIISLEEAEFVFEKGCDTLVLGSGQYGNVKLSPEAAEFFERHGCRVILKPTPDAIETYNKTIRKAKAIGLFHVTC